MKKKIGIFLGSLGSLGGTERMTMSLANALDERGFAVSLISATPFDKTFFEINDKIKLIQIKGANPYLDFSSYPKVFSKQISALNKIVKENNIEILINSDADLAVFTLPLKFWNKNLKLISWEHNNYKVNHGSRRRDISRRLAKRYSAAVVTLTHKDKLLYEEDGKAKAKIIAINNFINDNPAEVSQLNNKNVLSVGQFIDQKGFDILVDVWEIVIKNPNAKNWIINVVGKGPDKEKIRKLVKTKNLEDSFKICEATPTIEDYYLTSSIYVMTSRHEGLPMVLIEAKSYGLPIVSFDCITGPRDIIRNEIDGFLIPIKDALPEANRTDEEKTEMANRILELMENESLRKEMGRKAKEDSVRFTKDVILDQWEKLFSEL